MIKNSWQTPGDHPFGGAIGGLTNYMGIRFDNAGGNVGWLAYTIDWDNHIVGISGFAYEDSGGPIKSGQTGDAVPEPPGLALLACGTAGIYALRRKRKSMD